MLGWQKKKSHGGGGTKMKKNLIVGWHKNEKKSHGGGGTKMKKRNLMVGVAQK
jgi:hypothetical protein